MSATPHPTDPANKPKFGKRKLVLIAIPVALLAIGAGLWFSGVLPHLLGQTHDDHKEEVAKPSALIFVDVPEMVANLNSPSARPSYLKLVARLEVARTEDVERVKQAMPRLQDLFQTYLREMRPDELRGSAGSYHLREELIARANIAVMPARVTNILFVHLLIQ